MIDLMAVAWCVSSLILSYSVGRVSKRSWVGPGIGTMLLLGGLWLGVLPLGLTILGLLGVLWMEFGVIIN